MEDTLTDRFGRCSEEFLRGSTWLVWSTSWWQTSKPTDAVLNTEGGKVRLHPLCHPCVSVPVSAGRRVSAAIGTSSLSATVAVRRRSVKRRPAIPEKRVCSVFTKISMASRTATGSG